jgi:hypothetical protein
VSWGGAQHVHVHGGCDVMSVVEKIQGVGVFVCELKIDLWL